MVRTVARFILVEIFIILILLFVIRNSRMFSPSYFLAEIAAMADNCTVDPGDAKVHGKAGEKKYEDAWILSVDNDNTIQVQTVETKLTLLFELKPKIAKCFREGSIVPVTIKKCARAANGECDFSRSHKVYIRTEKVNVIAWKYTK